MPRGPRAIGPSLRRRSRRPFEATQTSGRCPGSPLPSMLPSRTRDPATSSSSPVPSTQQGRPLTTSALARETASRVLRELSRRYLPSGDLREGETALAKITTATEDPFRVLISTILSQRTRDERTEEASSRLFASYDTPQALADAPLEEVTDLIRPAGFYRQKAAKIREVSRILLERHGGGVPDTYEELMRLPQVGPKTANCVLVYGFG